MNNDDSDASGSNKVIISVTMQNEIKNRIDKLVSEGVARSRTQMIEDAVRWYLDFTVYKWNERGIYINDVRVLFEPENIASLFFSSLRPNDQYEIGITAGKQAPIVFQMLKESHALLQEIAISECPESGPIAFSGCYSKNAQDLLKQHEKMMEEK